MKTYDECVKKIAIKEANRYYAGESKVLDYDSRMLVAWIFDKTPSEVADSIKAIAGSAGDFALIGKEF